jgi:hypothetical protein
MGERVDNAKTMRGMYVEENSGVLFLILQFFGLPIVNYILIQSTLNDIISFDQYNSGATAFTTF